MARRSALRLADVLRALDQIERLLSGVSLVELKADPIKVAAFERFLEIVGEATRHLPEELKSRHGDVPWRQVADLGNVLRRIYHNVDVDTLWDIHLHDLPTLRTVVTRMLREAQEKS